MKGRETVPGARAAAALEGCDGAVTRGIYTGQPSWRSATSKRPSAAPECAECGRSTVDSVACDRLRVPANAGGRPRRAAAELSRRPRHPRLWAAADDALSRSVRQGGAGSSVTSDWALPLSRAVYTGSEAMARGLASAASGIAELSYGSIYTNDVVVRLVVDAGGKKSGTVHLGRHMHRRLSYKTRLSTTE
jgi:hypothetical protein